MTSLYKKGSMFLVAGVLYLVGQYFRGVWFLGSDVLNVCGHAEAGGVPFCNSPFIDTFGYPLITAGIFFAIIAILLLAAKERAFHRWLRFSLYYVPIAIVLIIVIFPVSLPLDASISYDSGVQIFGRIYVLVTLYIVIREWFRKQAA